MNPSDQTPPVIEYVPVRPPRKWSPTLTYLAVIVPLAIVATLLIHWIYSRFAIISGTISGWGVYGQAIGVIILLCLLIWAFLTIRRSRRIVNDPRGVNQRSDAKNSEWRTFWRIVLWVVALGIIFCIALWVTRKWYPRADQQQAFANYHKLICDNAWQNDVQEPAGDHFTVKLHEGCFGGFVHLPAGWHEWHYQPVGNDPGWWFSPWFDGSREPEGLYDRNARPYFAFHPTAFRLQGKEGQEILFYTSDVVVKPTAIRELNQITHVTPPATPLLPDGKAYHVGKDGVTAPLLLKKVEPAYTDEARRANFSGRVTVNFVVDENGNPTDLDIVDLPGFSLEENILTAVRQWKFRPGMKDGVPVPVYARITTQFQK